MPLFLLSTIIMSLLLSLFKELLICSKKERLELNISPSLLKQAKLDDSYAQLEIASRYFSKAKKHYAKKSTYWFTRSAENNNKEAMSVLGTLYLKGKNVHQNFQQAIAWYEKAASLGHTKAIKMLSRVINTLLQQKITQQDHEAMYQLANYCVNGELGFVDHPKACMLYQKSADLGNTNALVNLASLYEKGLGINKDPQKAANLYLQAAKKQNDTAMLNIGILYFTGEGIEQNFNLGIDWLLKSAQYGNSKASFNLGVFYYKQNNTSEALKHFTHAANNGHLEAMFNLGILYQTDTKNPEHIKKSNYWLNKASTLGHRQASKSLAINQLSYLAIDASAGNRDAIKNYTDLCITHHIKIDNNRLINWLYKSAELGNSDAMVDIGNFYTYGTPPVTQDYQQAIHWFTKASDLNNDQAMNLLGLIYLEGRGATINKQIAIDWFTKSVALGNDKAMVNMANIYLENTPTDINYQQAYQWLLPAAEKGNRQAIQLIISFYKVGLGITKDLEKATYWQQLLKLKNETKK